MTLRDRRLCIYAVAAVVEDERILPHGTMRRQIIRPEKPASCFDASGKAIGKLAVVEVAQATSDHSFQGCGKIGLAQPRAHAGNLAVAKECLPASRIGPQTLEV